MKQSLTFFRQFAILVLFVGLTACGSKSDPLKAEIEESMQTISDQLTVLKAVTMEQNSVVDGLEEDLKWEYSPEFEKGVKAYVTEVEHLNDNVSELNSIYDELAGHMEKLEKGAPLEYSHTLIEEMAMEKIDRAEEIFESNEQIQEKLFELEEQLDEL
ncbi:hypothetical protein [Prosthecochloris sp. HL-130-GSB]|jgi:uncharacterized protein YoxC|uniref:hypothetical protein n=1 Tax=Prosthecochloris sp. HL-130-GSB TaxID=1974213 RepID=UPI000A1C0C9E|nr:hypothetical protein [Prosthecochloris sp. HL-130-GSB]ARM30968.1 hypothetical protein B9H02_06215 [Prosthecochloris sp. HL-130-GSB]MBO8092240.1 hypothetical protein [Prosthecochloris sp.]